MDMAEGRGLLMGAAAGIALSGSGLLGSAIGTALGTSTGLAAFLGLTSNTAGARGGPEI